MGFYDFPHTRNYDSDLGFLIKRYNELIEKVDNIESDILKKAKDYTDEQLSYYQSQLDNFRNEITGIVSDFENTVNANIVLMNARIDRFGNSIDNKIKDVDNRTDIKIENNNNYLKDYISSQLIDVKVVNAFTGNIVTVQEMFNYLSRLHSNGVLIRDLISRNNKVNDIISYNVTLTDLFTNGNVIIIQK